MARLFAAFTLLLTIVTLAPVSEARAAWPERPVTLIVPWEAGGGADALARVVSALLYRELNQPVHVRNRPAQDGVEGREIIANEAPDGYTIGLVTTELAMMHWQGQTGISFEDITPLALLSRDPSAVFVRVDSRLNRIDKIPSFLRGKHSSLTAGGGPRIGVSHLALAGFLKDRSIPPSAVQWEPSAGSAPAFKDLLDGEVDLVVSGIPEASSLLNAGLIRGLAVMDGRRNPGYPAIPTLHEAINSDWTMASFRGIAAPKDLPQDIKARLVGALLKVYESPEFKEFMAQRGFSMYWSGPEDFSAFLKENDTSLGRVMHTLGLTQKTAAR